VLFPDDRDVDGISTLPSAGVSRIWEDDRKPCLPNLFTPPSPSRIFSCSDQYISHVAGAASEQLQIDFTIFPHIKTGRMAPQSVCIRKPRIQGHVCQKSFEQQLTLCCFVLQVRYPRLFFLQERKSWVTSLGRRRRASIKDLPIPLVPDLPYQ
jgi:hypothetical protein